MWMLAIAAVVVAILAVVVLVRRHRRMPSFLDVWEPLDGRANPEPTPTRPCDHRGDCKHIVSMWEFNEPPVHSNPSPEGLAMAREWAENLKCPTLDASKRAYLEQHRQEIQSALRQSVSCAHCPHAARYHANKGLDPKGKCDPWYMGDRCDCPGFEPATSEQFRPFPPPPRAC